MDLGVARPQRPFPHRPRPSNNPKMRAPAPPAESPPLRGMAAAMLMTADSLRTPAPRDAVLVGALIHPSRRQQRLRLLVRMPAALTRTSSLRLPPRPNRKTPVATGAVPEVSPRRLPRSGQERHAKMPAVTAKSLLRQPALTPVLRARMLAATTRSPRWRTPITQVAARASPARAAMCPASTALLLASAQVRVQVRHPRVPVTKGETASHVASIPNRLARSTRLS